MLGAFAGSDTSVPLTFEVTPIAASPPNWPDRAVVDLASLVSPSFTGDIYHSRDLLTQPPTQVQIMAAIPAAQHGAPPFALTFADIEPTAGWLSDRNNATLDICFMHSFGKCFGKAKEKDARTCHQIHVKRDVLDRLRRLYVNPQRNYFCRTMKANITEKFSQVLSLLARRRFTLQYLEFKTDDFDVTAGSTAYEVQYRHWLVSDCRAPRVGSKPGGAANTENFISSSDLCWDFALTGRCAMGATCIDLHGHVAKALTKDRFVRSALEEMSKKEGNATPVYAAQQGFVPGLTPGVQQKQQQQQQQRHQQSQPQHVAKRAAQGGTPSYVDLTSGPMAPIETIPFQISVPSLQNGFQFPTAFGMHNDHNVAPPTFINSGPQQFGDLPQTNGIPPHNTIPFFVVSEGADSILRFIPMNSFGQLNPAPQN